MDSSRFTQAAGELLLNAISDAGGREVLAVGKLDDDGLISEIKQSGAVAESYELQKILKGMEIGK